MRHADAAMYNAKRGGRACYAIYQQGLSETALHRLQLGNDFRLALPNDELELHYQPQIDLKSGHICGVEALVRWHHPVRGTVSPVEFVPVAEEIGLAGALGRWVLRRACEQAFAWNALSPAQPLQMSVNISAQQLQKPRGHTSVLPQGDDTTMQELHQPHLMDDVAQILVTTGLAPERLLLEITEDGAMEAGDATLSILNALKSLGVGLSIDDFGTGYSNLSYLKEFPLDTLKIDRRFVTGLQPNSKDAMILHSLTELAHALQLKVVAEGAETKAEFEQLRELGCDIVQGFYFARPMSARDFEFSSATTFPPTRRIHAHYETFGLHCKYGAGLMNATYIAGTHKRCPYTGRNSLKIPNLRFTHALQVYLQRAPPACYNGLCSCSASTPQRQLFSGRLTQRESATFTR